MRREAFERLYAEHAGPLVAFLTYRVGDRELAEDLAADTFERALRTRFRLDTRRGSEKAWLYTIALNLVRDHLRREDARRRASERAPRTPTAYEGGIVAIDERDAVGRALAELGEAEQEAIALRYGADLSFAEIAGVTGEKPTTVESRVYRSLRRLRGLLTVD